MLTAGEDIGLSARVAGIARRLGAPVLATASRQADVVESLRRTGSDLGYVLTKRYSFSREDIAPSLVEFVAAMLSGTPVGVLSDFVPHLATLDARTALAAVSEAHTLVVGAGGDRITPVQHSRDIVTDILDAEYLEVPDAGHMVMLEHPDLVTAHLRSLVARSTRGTAAAIDDPGVAPVPLPRPSRRQRRARKQS
jgi:pimeloyl-ACP methyl ester carboxylesterase